MTNDKTLKIVGAIAVVGIAAIGAGYLLTHQGGQTTPTQKPSTTPSGQGTTPSGQTSSGTTTGAGTTQQVNPPTAQTQPTQTGSSNATAPTQTQQATNVTPTQPTTPVQGTVDLSTILATKTNTTLDAIKKDISENPAAWKIVVGEYATAADVLGAAEVAAALQYLAKKEETKKIDLSGIKVVLEKNETIVKGAIPFYTEASKLYLGDKLDSVVPLITKGSGEIKGDSDTTYSYTVYIKPSDAQIVYKDRPDTDAKDPTVMVYSGGNTGFLTVEIRFTPALNLTDVRGKAITILGKKFYLDVDNSGNLVLRDASLDTQLQVGQSVDFNGHKITLKDIVSQEGTWYAVVEVDGKSATIKIHDSDSVNGVDIYVQNAYKSEVQSGVGYAELLIGGKKYVLEDGKGILVGGTDEDDRTLVHLKKSGNEVSEIDITFFKDRNNADSDYLMDGETYTLPFIDTYKLVFTPTSLTEGKYKISLVPAGDKEYDLSVTDFRGYKKTIPIKYSTDSGKFGIMNLDASGYSKFDGTITGKGTDSLEVKSGYYFAVYNKDQKESYLYEVSKVYEENSVKKADLEDVFSGQTITVTDGSEIVLAGYTINVSINTTTDTVTFKNVDVNKNSLIIEGENDIVYNITQGSDAIVSVSKEFKSISPKYTEDVLATVYYDSDNSRVDVKSLDVKGYENPVIDTFKLTASGITAGNLTIENLTLTVNPDRKVSGYIKVKYDKYEETIDFKNDTKTSATFSGDYFNGSITLLGGAEFYNTTTTVNGVIKVTIKYPEGENKTFTLTVPLNITPYNSVPGGDYIEKYLTKAGIYVDQENTNDQDQIYIYVPKEAVSYNIELEPVNATTKKVSTEVAKGQEIDETGWYVESISGVPTEYTETTLQPLVTGVAVLDTQVTPADTKLISIGGPDVNRVTADFLGVSYPTKINGLTGGLIKAAELNGRVAVLIMGNNADATRMAAREFALYLTEDKDASAFANATAVKVSGTAEAPTAEKLQ